MKRILTKIFMVVTATLLFTPVVNYSETTDEALKLYVNVPYTLFVSGPIRVSVANPNVLDVVQVTKKEITLSPKAVGKTSLAVLDLYGEQIYSVTVCAENMQAVKIRVDNLLAKLNFPEVYTQAEDEESKIYLLGKVKTAQDRERVNSVLGSLREKTIDLLVIKEEEQAIEIDVQVLELDKDASSTLGFTWPSSINIIEQGSPGIAAGGTSFGQLFKLFNVQRGISDGVGGSVIDPYTLRLDALIQEGKARVLSRPRLVCQSGKEAKLLVGGEVPIFTADIGSGGTVSGNVEYKEYGIIMNMKPRIDDSGRIHLNLGVEVSEIQPSVSTPYALAYPLTKRNADTELFLDDGQTMAIGGLIKQRTTEDLRKFPWLGDVPILGMFFRQRTTSEGGGSGQRGDVELFITLTPRIVDQSKSAGAPTLSGRPGKEEVAVSKDIKPAALALAQESVQVAPLAIEEGPVDPMVRYTRIIQNRILENLTYPQATRDANYQGTVKLSLKLSFSGDLLEAKVKNSSGYSALDDSALSTAKKAAPYPPFPPNIEQKELRIEVPIVYRLD